MGSIKSMLSSQSKETAFLRHAGEAAASLWQHQHDLWHAGTRRSPWTQSPELWHCWASAEEADHQLSGLWCAKMSLPQLQTTREGARDSSKPSNQHEPTEQSKPTHPKSSTFLFLSGMDGISTSRSPSQQTRTVKRQEVSIASRLVSAARNPNLCSGLQICVFVLEIKALIFDAKHLEYWWACSQKRFRSYLSTQNCAV